MEDIKNYVLNKKAALKEEISTLNRDICLAIVQVNDDIASNVYIKGKLKDLEEVGMKSKFIKLDNLTTQDELLNVISKLNEDETVNGIIVQLPLPESIDEYIIKKAIIPSKDADGFSPLAIVDPATPKGILNYLIDNDYKFDGKNAVVIGRSEIVGKPMAKLLLEKNMNCVVLHSHTTEEDKRFYLEHADLIVVSVGKEKVLDKTYKLKKDAVVIDVGINRVDGKLVGDCEKDLDVYFQSSVPGGVGLLTRLQLLMNLKELADLWNSK